MVLVTRQGVPLSILDGARPDVADGIAVVVNRFVGMPTMQTVGKPVILAVEKHHQRRHGLAGVHRLDQFPDIVAVELDSSLSVAVDSDGCDGQ